MNPTAKGWRFMDDDVQVSWGGMILDEDDLPEEERRYRRVWDIDTDFIIYEEVEDDEPSVDYEEELDPNAMYCYYEESDYY